MQEPDKPFTTRDDVPPVRDRAPSPVRRVLEAAAPPPPARDLVITPNSIEVIYAEDEEVFRETTILELLKAGFQRQNIFEAENGLGALEHLARLQNEGHAELPLLVLLDVRMPSMDGRECALQIQELNKQRLLRREPFVVCISSLHRQVCVDEGKGNFQVVLPKPINQAFIEEVVHLLKQWWTLGYGRQMSAWKVFDPAELDIICADTEPVCQLAASTAFTTAGVSPEAVFEVDDDEELIHELTIAQDGDASRPLIVLLGVAEWAPRIRSFVDATKAQGLGVPRTPFVVCTSVDSQRIGSTGSVENFHAFLPRNFSQADVKWCLEFCRLWWQTRGDGPEEADDDESSCVESVGSIGMGD